MLPGKKDAPGESYHSREARNGHRYDHVIARSTQNRHLGRIRYETAKTDSRCDAHNTRRSRGLRHAAHGPSVAVMPAAHEPFDVFQQEMSICKQYAEQQVSGQAEAANAQAVGTAFLSTGLGAALGGALGGGGAAGVGAASGAIAGTGAGAAENPQAAQPAIQQHYDTAFEQCMYAKGNQVPAFQPAAASAQ